VSVLRVRLTAADDLTADKQAWAVVRPQSARRVLMVTPGDFFLQTALALDPSVQLTTETPAAYSPLQLRRFDLVVFAGFLPTRMPIAPVLVISPPAEAANSMSFGGYLATGASSLVVASAAPAEIAQFVDVSDVRVARARQASLPGWMQPVITAGGTTILAAGQNGNIRGAVAPFNLQDSDWPLRVSFPVLIQNLVQYLAPGVEMGINVPGAAISAGELVKVTPDPGVHEIDVSTPNGVTRRITTPFAPFSGTSQPGVYRVREVGRKGTVQFAVNFMPARPAAAAGPADVVVGTTQRGGSTSIPVPVELGWIVALACLSFLTAEWWLAFRR
jgi:hypothetical protein